MVAFDTNFRVPVSGEAAARAVAGLAGLAAGGLFYSTVIERNAFTLRHTTMAVLEPGATPLRVLHISDLHMMPRQHLKQAWLSELDALEPDLVVNTGDNLSHPAAVPAVVQSLGGLLSRPGLFVFGSNDYFGPKPKNPFKYFKKNHKRTHGDPLPWQDLRAAFVERGWLDATHTIRELEVAGVRIAAAGVDDPHIERDRYETVAGRPNPLAHLRLGLTHSPEPRVRPGAGRTYTWRPVVFAVLRCAGHQLPYRSVAREGSVELGFDDEVACECWNRDVAVCSGPVLLPSGGKLVDTDPGLTRRRRFRRSVLLAACDGRQGARQTLVVQRTVSILRARQRRKRQPSSPPS